jgi:hypothetical protein
VSNYKVYHFSIFSEAEIEELFFPVPVEFEVSNVQPALLQGDFFEAPRHPLDADMAAVVQPQKYFRLK